MNKYLPAIGAILAGIVGAARGFGGFTLLVAEAQTAQICVGTGLIVVGIWLICTAIAYVIKPSARLRAWLTAGVVAFLVDGIVNGFVLFGAPQLSGQIANFSVAILILLCLWLNPRASRA